MARVLRTSTPQFVFQSGPPSGLPAVKGAGTTTAALTRCGIYVPQNAARIAKFWFAANTIGSSSAGSTVTITPCKKGQTTGSALSDGATCLTTLAAGGISSIAIGPAVGGGGSDTQTLGCVEGDEIDMYCVHSTTCTTGPAGLIFNVLWQL